MVTSGRVNGVWDRVEEWMRRARTGRAQ
jgi:hypothetical protein